MASSDILLHSLTLTSFLLILFAVPIDSHRPRRCYESIISFGDSIADTGNLLILSDPNHLPHFALPPYGETFFHFPTGRHSDGRLIIDFIVAGATALDISCLKGKGVPSDITNVSLGVQLNIFKEILPSLCSPPSDCSEFLSRSLILMGEIGGNDYNYPFFAGKNVDEIREMVPLVINVISSAIRELVDMGGRTFLVPGNFPIGCSAAYLTMYQTENMEKYDPLTGCLKWLNEFAEHHNERLQIELNRLRKLYPHVNIVYADYYNVVLRLFQDPIEFGFMNRPLSVCCGAGGPYNYSPSRLCGDGVPYCDNPSKYVNWDGFHLTEHAYRWIAKGLLKGPYADPAFNSYCFDSKLQNSSPDKDMSLSL
ncbi:PREDICTED: GDSL esterase/lipase At1g28580-like isoform X2 [Tarenaya hassleriana]|uniref:GDSL esterase/lipase At1g28580-like isoform X2 n=1 Tax=Tarenaya hassleriana TaxID=28532 RepID=UPI00053C391E|nr:PREDICTED: GDSL esterase/lipase At1g28580-like isoform X2 [Tarenaya hassleriana]